LNYQVFLDSCRGFYFTLFESIVDMQADILLRRLKQFSHLDLRQPDSDALVIRLWTDHRGITITLLDR
jgi:hypothetical protein